MADYIPAQSFPPGAFIKEEIDAREWTQGDLAAIISRPIQAVNELISGKRAITADTARALGDAFGTGPEYWMNLESLWRLSQTAEPDSGISKRAKLFSVAPVKELIRRKWIAESGQDDKLERRVLFFMGMESVSETPKFRAAARTSKGYTFRSSSQVAWLKCAERLAESVSVKSFQKKKFLSSITDIRDLAGHEADIRRVPRFLSELGVRLVVVENLQDTGMDGAAFWLSPTDPVIALGLRYDRIDNFWYTLDHEIGHLINGDGQTFFDENLVGEDAPKGEKPECERIADEFAAQLLIPPAELQDFINRVRPLYSRAKIIGFANRMGVHPGIVIGQLQHRGEIGYWHSRPLLSKVRAAVVSSTMADGWGNYAGPWGDQDDAT